MSQSNQQKQFYAGKVVALTGANRGIGLALATALVRSGATVFAGCRSPKEASELQQLAAGSENKLTVLPLDVAEAAAVAAFAGHLPAKVDVLFNNAGVNIDHGEQPAALPADALAQTFAVNTVGPLRTMQALHGRLTAAGGRVANISSIMGSIAENESGGNTAYRVSKAALNMLNKNFALASDRVIYLALHPGWVQTDMGGPKAPVQTADSAAGLLRVVAAATPAQSGTFVRFDGQRAPW